MRMLVIMMSVMMLVRLRKLRFKLAISYYVKQGYVDNRASGAAHVLLGRKHSIEAVFCGINLLCTGQIAFVNEYHISKVYLIVKGLIVNHLWLAQRARVKQAYGGA